MPKSMVRKFMAEGLSKKAAEAKTARIVNARKSKAKASRGGKSKKK